MDNSILFLSSDTEDFRIFFKALLQGNFSARRFPDSEEFLDSIRNDTPLLIFIQTSLLAGRLTALIAELRRVTAVPIVLLFNEGEEEAVGEAMECGADYFFSWKCSERLFLEWVKAFFKRNAYFSFLNEEGLISFRGFVFHEKGRYLEYHSKKIRMADKELDVLQVLLKNAGKRLTSKYIFSQVWGEVFGDISTVGVHIKRIRLKLAQYDSYPYINNVYKSGYVFDKKCIGPSAEVPTSIG